MTAPDEQPNDHEQILDSLDRLCSEIASLTDILLVSIQYMETEMQREIVGNLSGADRTLRLLRQEFQKARIFMEMDGLVPPG